MGYVEIVVGRMQSARLQIALGLLVLAFMVLSACEGGVTSPAGNDISQLAPTADDGGSAASVVSSDEQQAGGDAATGSDDASASKSDAVSDDGDASKTAAVSGDGDVSTTEAASGDDDASKTEAASDDSDTTKTAAVSGDDGDTSKTDAVSGDGDASKTAAVSDDGDVSKTDAVSGDGDTTKTTTVSGDGDTTKTVAVSSDGDTAKDAAALVDDGDASKSDTVSDDGVTADSDQPVGLDYALTLEGNQYNSYGAAYFRGVWKKSLDAAFVTSKCPTVEKVEYPAEFYQGPLIDSHLHIPQLSDNFGDDDDQPATGGGVDSELYDAIAENDRPVLGVSVTIDDIACTLKQEGTVKAFAFFPVFQDFPAALVDSAYQTKERYGSLFVPFIQSTNSQISGVEGKVLQQMLDLRPGLFAGTGEIGDSPSDPVNLPPDDPFYTGAFEVAQANGLMVYFHPGVGDHENLDRALKMFPDTNFIVHADFVRPYIGDLMASNPNVYYTFNDIFDEVTPLFRFGDKQDFIDAMERDWDELLDQAIVHYEDLINEYPDRFMWGTDRVDIVWNYDADIGRLLVKLAREFIGRLDPAVQDRVGYLNAERLVELSGR